MFADIFGPRRDRRIEAQAVAGEQRPRDVLDAGPAFSHHHHEAVRPLLRAAARIVPGIGAARRIDQPAQCEGRPPWLGVQPLPVPGQQGDLARGVRERIPLKRHGTESEIAGAIVYLLSDAAAYVTGIALRVDGGLHNMARSSFYEVPEHDRSKPYNGFPLYRRPKVLD